MIISGNIAGGGRCRSGWLVIDEGRIAAVGEGEPPRPADIVHLGLISRGLVDLQVNGGVGVETVGGHLALDQLDAFELAHGVTSYLATIITTEETTATRAVDELAERVADPLSAVAGIHLEGPFLSPSHHGVHRRELLRLPVDVVPRYYEHPAIRMVTLAPELPGALDLIEWLVARGVVVSIGHSGADASTLEVAVARGASLVTHLFNAMPRFHHRAPGLAGWALVNDGVALNIVPDGLHVSPAVLELVRRAAGRRVLLISDSSVAAGAPPGDYVQAEIPIRRDADGSVKAADGSFAGSGLSLDEAVRRWTSFTADALPTALERASAGPAAAIGLSAELVRGVSADLVLVDAEGRVVRTMHRGHWAGSAPLITPQA